LDKQIVQRSMFGTLRVSGIIEVRKSQIAGLQKINDEQTYPKILKLELVLNEPSTKENGPQRVFYAEALDQEKQYETIEIFYKNKKILSIKRVPVVG